MSLAISATSIATEPAVPTPGIVPSAPDVASAAAPLKSPAIARSAANQRPAPRPINGIFLTIDLPAAPKALVTAFLINVLSATFDAALPTDSAASFPATLPKPFAAALCAIFSSAVIKKPGFSAILVTVVADLLATSVATFSPAEPVKNLPSLPMPLPTERLARRTDLTKFLPILVFNILLSANLPP